MKGLVQFINEAANTTAIVNKIKKEFKKEFGDKVTIGSGRANYQQLYDVYIYDMDINTLKKVNDILKKHITIWKGFTDEEMQKKLDDKKEFFDKHKDDKYVSLDRYPVEFFRFTSRDLRKIYEGCGGETEHKIVKDAAGNWRIKGTPGKGTNTDKEGLWAAKYKTEEDAKKALAAYHISESECGLSSEMTYHAHLHEAVTESRYHIHESKNTFTLDDNERDALKEFLGIVTGNIGEESEIKKYEGLFKSLGDGEFDKLSDIYDFIEDDRTYPKVTYKNFQQDERQLVKKCIDWAEENDLIDNNYDLMDAAEKIA